MGVREVVRAARPYGITSSIGFVGNSWAEPATSQSTGDDDENDSDCVQWHAFLRICRTLERATPDLQCRTASREVATRIG